MKTEIFKGQVRELVNALATAVAAFGYANEEITMAVGGFVVSAVMFFWGINQKEGVGVLASLARKMAGSIAAASLTFGWINQGELGALEAVFAAVIPLVMMFSAKSNGADPPRGLPLIALGFVAVCFLPSCSGVGSLRLSFETPDGGTIGVDIPIEVKPEK